MEFNVDTFKKNYINKIYDIMLTEIYAEEEDYQTTKARFDCYFEEFITPELLNNGGIRTDDGGIEFEGFTYYNYSDVTKEYLENINFEDRIRDFYGIPGNYPIEEYHPSAVCYYNINQLSNVHITYNFYRAVSDIFGRDKGMDYDTIKPFIQKSFETPEMAYEDR